MGKIKDRKVIEFSKKIRKNFSVDKIIFFGSRARGDFLEESDYDFVIVSKDFRGIPFRDRIKKIYDFWRFKEDIEVLCYTPEEFEKKVKQVSVVREAFKKGVEI